LIVAAAARSGAHTRANRGPQSRAGHLGRDSGQPVRTVGDGTAKAGRQPLTHRASHDSGIPSFEMSAADVVVKAGDTIDFIVDIGRVLNSDQFLWSPVIKAGGTTWNARAEFSGPKSAPELLTPWEQYAQVLLLANEFSFAD
jgi:hypothetical protein